MLSKWPDRQSRTLRLKWSIDEIEQLYPVHVVTHALFPELPDVRTFQAALDSIQLPVGQRQLGAQIHKGFTDGSCLHPRHRDPRVSGGSVVLATESDYVTVWRGLVPGAQGTFRAELLAAATAAGMLEQCEIYSDCWAFVWKANRLLSRHRLGLPVELPKSHRDLWSFFWERATAEHVVISIFWTPAHRSLASLSGHELYG